MSCPFSMASGPTFLASCLTLTLSGLYLKVLVVPFLRLTVKVSSSGRTLVTAPLNDFQFGAAFCSPLEPSYWLFWLVWLLWLLRLFWPSLLFWLSWLFWLFC